MLLQLRTFRVLVTLLSLPILLGILHINTSNAQQIEGTIRDLNQQPLPGVNVYLEDINRGAATDSAGYFQLTDLPTGTHIIRYSLIGYQTMRDTVTVREGQTTRRTVVMKERTVQGEELTVTGTPYATSPLATPSDVEVMTGSSKMREQEASLGGSLERMAGISNISTGGQVGKPVIRGLSGQRVRVLQDGMNMEYQQFGVRHGPNLDPFVAERIEVVRGASSVQYGSDALGGAINVVSNHIPDARNQSSFVQGRLLTEYATNNNEKVGGVHMDAAKGGWGATATIVTRAAGNIHVPKVPTYQDTDNPEAPKFSGELPYTDYDQISGNVGFGYAFDGGRLTADYIRWSNEQNFLLPSGEGLGQSLSNDHLHLSGTFDIRPTLDVEADLSYQRNVRKSNAPGDPRSRLPSSDNAYLDLLLENYAGHIDLVHREWGPFSGRAGIEVQQQYQNTRGEESLVPSADLFNLAGFIFERFEYRDWIFNAGLRFDYRTHTVKPNAELNLPNPAAGESESVLDGLYTEFSGSLGAIYRLTDELSVAANLGRGFRAPSIFELHAEGVHGGVAAYQVGNPYLESERSLSSDISVRYRADRVNAKATVYRNQIDNYIMLVNTGQFAGNTPILRNEQADAVMIGGNVSAGVRLTRWLSAEGVAEMVQGETRGGDLSVDELPLLPASSFTFSLRFNKEQLGFVKKPFLDVALNHTLSKEAAGRYEPFWQFGNAPQFSEFGVASTDAYTLINVQTGFDFQVGPRMANLIISVDNLLNTEYRSFLDTYKGYALSPGRNVSFRMIIPISIL